MKQNFVILFLLIFIVFGKELTHALQIPAHAIPPVKKLVTHTNATVSQDGRETTAK